MVNAIFPVLAIPIVLGISLLVVLVTPGPLASARRLRVLGISSALFSTCCLVSALILSLRSGQPIHAGSSFWEVQLPGRTSLLGAVVYSMFAVGLLASPKRALETRSARLLFPCMILIFPVLCSLDPVATTVAAVLLYTTLGAIQLLERYEAISDAKARARAKVFFVYQLIGMPLLAIGLLSLEPNVLPAGERIAPMAAALPLSPQIAGIFLLIGAAVTLGLFPFHSSALACMSAPRLNPLPSITMVSGGIVLLFSQVLPRLGDTLPYEGIVLATSACGLLYFSLLLFGERKLKRIAALLYLMYLSLLTIGIALHVHRELALLTVNIVVASAGIAAVLSILSGRFGDEGVISKEGLFSAVPETGVCFLVSTLSIVGFPGTLGFIGDELLSHAFSTDLLLLGCLAVALALNGYSVFRVFGRAFFGSEKTASNSPFPLLVRERVAVLAVILTLISHGLAPQVIAIVLAH